MNQPLVTICILSYNNASTIKKTLDSALAQTYPNIEILVSDNGSKDATPDIIKSFTDPRISLRHNIKKIQTDKPYIGSYDNYNGCIESGLIHGEYVAFWHSDDIYKKDAIEKQVAFLTAHPKAGAVFTMADTINEYDTVIGTRKLPQGFANPKNLYDFTQILNGVLWHGNMFLMTPTFMARAATLKNVGLFGSEGFFGTSADLDMWLKIAKQYPIGILPEPLMLHRIGGGGKTYQKTRNKRSDFFTVVDHHLKKELPAGMLEKKYLDQYECQKYIDDTLLAINFLIQKNTQEAKTLINKPLPPAVIKAFFQNISLKRLQIGYARIIMWIGLNLGAGKLLSRILAR